MKKNAKVFAQACSTKALRLGTLMLALLVWVLNASPASAADYPATRYDAAPPSTITGKVTDAKNAPLEGVSVVIKGTNKGVTTNASGLFSFPNVPDNATLVFSYTGFGTKEVSVKASQGPINISMSEQVSGLGDVVVVGYGTARKKDLTGAVAQVKATQFENENPRSVQDMLRGNAPGLDVGFDASTKGSNSSLQIRGKGTLLASSSPLIVVDGVIFRGGLEDVNPNDIATIDILKDASSAAVFGAQSANGVILITTKKGKVGKPIITFNDNIGLNQPANRPHLLNANEFITWRQDVRWAMLGFDSTSKPGIKYRFTNPNNLPSNVTLAQWLAFDGSGGDPESVWLTRLGLRAIEVANYKAGTSLDWEKLMLNYSALQHDHTISIAQRRDDYNYYFSVGYLENNGLTVGDRYKTFRTRFNLESNIAKYLTVGLNFQFAERDESSVPVSLSDLIRTTPWGSYYATDGVTLRASPNDDPGNNSHPFLGQVYENRLYKYDNLFGSVYAKGKLPWGFSYQVNFTPRLEFLREYRHQSSQNPLLATQKGISNRRNQTLYAWQIDNVINWNKKYGKHSFDATFLINAEKTQSWNTTIQASNFSPNDNLGFSALQSATLAPVVSTDDIYETGDALMGRLNYNYDQKYFLTITERRDGFSAFGQQNPRAYFPSVALAWAFSDEKFMKNASSWLDYAKARLSYGENGNRTIGRYAALSNLTAGTYVYITSGGTAINVGNVSAQNLSNASLKWESNRSINFGIDYSILKGIVSGSIDLYERTTNDLLVNRSLSIFTGFKSVISNLGEVKNSGFEISVNTNNMKRKNFEWRTTLALWSNRNKIIHLYGSTPDYDATGKQIGTSEKDDITNGWFIGRNIATVFDYRVTGVWQIADVAEAKKYGYKPGDFRLEDTNGDGQYTIADKQFLGMTTPQFSWNLRNEFKLYRNFDFAFTLYAKMGQLTQFNEAKNVDLFYDRSQFYQRPYWTPDNPINDYAAMMSNAGGPVTWNVWRKSSFVRISNVSLAYTLPSTLVKKWKIDALKVYFNVVNAAVFSDWKYFDPENKGLTPINFNFGLNLTL